MERIKKSIVIIFVGAVISFGLFVWYKQYSFRALKIYALKCVDLSKEVENQIDVDGREYHYIDSRTFDGHWFKCDYYVAEIANNSENDIYISYRNIDDPYHKTIIRRDENISLSYSRSDIIDIYGLEKNTSGISIEVDNYDYMGGVKDLIKRLLVFSVVYVFLITTLYYFYWEKIRYLKIVLGIGLVLCAIIAFLSIYLKLYPYIYTSCEYIAVLIGLTLPLLCNNFQYNEEISMQEKVLMVGAASMGMIYIIFSQMLNATHGWITYFAAYNQKAVFDYVLLNIVLFVALFLGIKCASGKSLNKLKKYLSSREFLFAVSVIEIILLIPLTAWRTEITPIIGIVLLLTELLLLFVLLYKKNTGINEIKKTVKTKQYFFYMLEGLILISTIINSVWLNYWFSDWDIYHSNWYYNSIYDVANNLPFSDIYQEAYGHFALFYKVPLSILGNNILSLFTITSLIMATSLLCFFITAHRLVKNKLYVIGIELCIFICFSHNFAYPMNLPHRIFFPAMLTLLMTNGINEFKRKHKVLGYLICLFSMLWCVEVGTFCIIVYIIYISLLKYISCNSIKNTLVCAIKNSILLPGSLLWGYFCVQVYHFIVLGKYNSSYSLKNFMGVLVDSDNMSAGQFNTFYFENAQWIYYWIFLIACLIAGLYKLGLFSNNNKSKYSVIMCSLASFGLGFMVIIISRPEDYTLVIAWVILLAFICLDKLKSVWISDNGMIHNFKILLMIPIIILISNILILLPTALKQIKYNVVDYKRFDYKLIRDDENKIKKYPIEEIYAVGDGMKLLYFDMGYKLDNNNGGLAPEGPGQLEELMNKTTKNYIFTDKEMTNSNYVKIEEISISNKIYTMYERK